MPQIFHRSMNTFSKATIFGGFLLVAALGLGWDQLNRSSYMTEADIVRDQPIPFSHEHHVSGLGIDCRYCHTTVETSSFAGIPPTQTCMNCHSLIWKDSPLLEPVRQSARTNQPLVWTRVHDLPDFVYFDHHIHIAKGIGCESCHGRVDQMPLMRRTSSLQMSWCLECHRSPEKALREPTEVFQFGISNSHSNQRHADLATEYQIDKQQLLDCWTCHR